MFCSSCGSNVTAASGFCPTCGARMPSGGAPSPSSQAAPPLGPMGYAQPSAVYVVPAMDYATWSTRVMGAIVDFLLVALGMGLLYAVLGGAFAALAGLSSLGRGFRGDGVDSAAGGICCLAFVLFPVASLLVGFFNSVYLVSTRGYSIGQGIVKIKVVDANGQLLTMGTAAIRLLVRVGLGCVPMLPMLDLLWPLWDERRQTLHDKAVNCYVINNPAGV
jgi:uncharacterized RDD family membrane protein YckC